MWMWRLCSKSMENQITGLDQIKTYHDRQVVLNYYDEDDFLHQRDGLYFNSIQIDEELILFMKDKQVAYQLSRNEYPHFKVLTDFNHHYLFYNDLYHVDIYFPY